MIFEQFVFRYVTTLPPTITSAEYGIYAPPGVRRRRDVLRGHPARAVAHEFHLLGARWGEHPALIDQPGATVPAIGGSRHDPSLS